MGRIARKIRRELERTLRQKTASFEAFRRGKERAETIKSLGQLLREGIDPLHALYANTTNLAGLFMEDLVDLPFLDRRVCAFIDRSRTILPGWIPSNESDYGKFLHALAPLRRPVWSGSGDNWRMASRRVRSNEVSLRASRSSPESLQLQDRHL